MVVTRGSIDGTSIHWEVRVAKDDSKPGGKLLRLPIAKRAQPTPKELTFKNFHLLVDAGELASASAMLEKLLGLYAVQAQASTQHYAGQYLLDPRHVQKTMQIATALAEGALNEVLSLLLACFGLSGPPLIIAHQALLDAARKGGDEGPS